MSGKVSAEQAIGTNTVELAEGQVSSGGLGLDTVRRTLGEVTGGVGDLLQVGIGKLTKGLTDKAKEGLQDLGERDKITLVKIGKKELSDMFTPEKGEAVAKEIASYKDAFKAKIDAASEDTKQELQSKYDNIYNTDNGVLAKAIKENYTLESWSGLAESARYLRSELGNENTKGIFSEGEIKKFSKSILNTQEELDKQRKDDLSEYKMSQYDKDRAAILDTNKNTVAEAKEYAESKDKKKDLGKIYEMSAAEIAIKLALVDKAEEAATPKSKGKKK